MTQPSATTTAPAPFIPTRTPTPRTRPAAQALSLGMVERMNPAEADQRQEGGPILPADVQAQVNVLLSALQSAGAAYNTLATGYPGIWETAQYPVEYRQQRAAEFMDAVFAKQRADLDRAAVALQAARDAVRQGLTPPLLGDPSVHELKLMNAREDVKLALQDVPASQPRERLDILRKLFDDALSTHPEPAVAFLLGATQTFRRLLPDPAARIEFAGQQKDMLRKLLPPSAEPYFTAGPELDQLERMLGKAESTRYFVARDNGLQVTVDE